ncbi:juvenile hormone esterase-like isoform X4 [Scylla paramamosain]|uniref:juvenile hormone esterase-like isoform X4 n=1 Tax=Scylla paramamosain TaxID=85552 RepID=UPI0030837167
MRLPVVLCFALALGGIFFLCKMMLMTVTVMLAVAAAAATENPHISPALVVVKQGSILGSRVKTSNGFVYYTFSTIPYARPPVGHLRFQDPKPAPAWSGVRNGSLPFPKCPQSTIFKVKNYDVDGQEDCLYLNVFTPRPYRSNLPVMVFIHGGALVAGSALGPVPPMLPVPLLEKDVVVVTMNYRLGALGFLSTGDGVLPGNLGFKDQTLALRWVQDNIGNLGGDPKKVTIFGVSAGAFSCHAHTLSPSSAGLFQRAILQSGTALLSAQFGPPQKGAIAISKALNCKGEESHQLLACFKAASVEDLVEAQSTLSEWYDIPLTVGAQVDGTFLPDFPAALLKSGRYNKVDLMVGWTRDDGDFITADFAYGMSALQSAELHGKKPHSKTFAYRLDHYLEKSQHTLLTNSYIQRKLAGHGDDNRYLFNFPPPLGPLTRPQDLHVRDIMVTLWTNFAHTGNPTVNGTLGFRWTPVSPKKPVKFLSITTNPTMQCIDEQKRDFWNSLPTENSKILYPEHFLLDSCAPAETLNPTSLAAMGTCNAFEFLCNN